MNTIRIQTQDLTGPALDWAVAKCTGHIDARRVVVDLEYLSGDDPVRWEPILDTYYSSAYSPSVEWAMGGPIIEREKISTVTSPDDESVWIGSIFEPDWKFNRTGPTPLIAAMRCYVASKLGDTVEVPEELK